MRILIAFCVLLSVAYGQPDEVRVNDTVTTLAASPNFVTISQDQKLDSFTGMTLTADKAPMLEFTSVVTPHPNAVVIDIEVRMNGAQGGGVYDVYPIVPNTWGNENFRWFDAWSDGDWDSDTYSQLAGEGVFDLNGEMSMTVDNGKYRFYPDSRFESWIILPSTTLTLNTFTSPQMVVTYGRPGDINGDYQIGVQDINQIRTGIQNYDARVDWDNNGFLNKADMELAADEAGIIPGDANLDGTVDAADLNILGIYWLQPIGLWQFGDFDRNGSTSVGDLNILALNWLDEYETFEEALENNPPW